MSITIDDFGAPMLGKTVREIRGGKPGDETMLLVMTDGSAFGFYHEQDCCETVAINDVCGDLSDLIGSPLLQAEEVSSDTPPDDLPKPEWEPESQTWTFYKFATIKGGVTIRWLGESNGYYSESVERVVFNAGDDVRSVFLDAPTLQLT